MSVTPLRTPRTVVTLKVYCGHAFTKAGPTLLASQSERLGSPSVQMLTRPPLPLQTLAAAGVPAAALAGGLLAAVVIYLLLAHLI